VLGRRDGRLRLVVKGAPEVVIDRCTGWQVDGQEIPLDAAAREEVRAHVQGLADDGLRVLAVARRSTRRQSLREADVDRLVLVGFVGAATTTNDGLITLGS
jgi:cation-transporting ATPase I